MVKATFSVTPHVTYILNNKFAPLRKYGLEKQVKKNWIPAYKEFSI